MKMDLKTPSHLTNDKSKTKYSEGDALRVGSFLLKCTNTSRTVDDAVTVQTKHNSRTATRKVIQSQGT